MTNELNIFLNLATLHVVFRTKTISNEYMWPMLIKVFFHLLGSAETPTPKKTAK